MNNLARTCAMLTLCISWSCMAAKVTTKLHAGSDGSIAKTIIDVIDPNAPQSVDPQGVVENGSVTPADAVANRINASKAIEPLRENAFGESVNPLTGNLSFFQTDVLLHGIGPDIAIQRSLDVGASRSPVWQRDRAFGDWALELPRMKTWTLRPSQFAPWEVAGANPGARCNGFGPASDANAALWWDGVQLAIPGEGEQEVLRRAPENGLAPTMLLNGSPLSFPLVTTQHWTLACLTQTSNGVSGEAFLAVSPTGNRYWFDRLVVGSWQDYQAPGFEVFPYQVRYEATLLPSRIEDRHGNSLSFLYDGARLTDVIASDGRAVRLTWQSVNGLSFITAVTEQPGDPKQRQWVYGYSYPVVSPAFPSTTRSLARVTLPDQSAWSFDFNKLTKYCAFWQPNLKTPCTDSGVAGVNTGTATSPSGLIGVFDIALRARYRHLELPVDVLTCFNEVTTNANEWFSLVLLTKKYRRSSIDDIWSYEFCEPSGRTCAADFPNASTFTTKNPEGHFKRETVGVTWCSAELGEVLRTDLGASFNAQGAFVTAMQTVIPQRAAPNAGPFPARIGMVPQTFSNRKKLEYLRPERRRDITRGGDVFTWTAETLDVFGRPLRQKHFSALGFQRTETAAYYDNFSKWLLGQTDSVTELGTGAVEQAQTFDTANGNVLTQSRFGKLENTITYNANGTVASSADGANHVTTFASYKYGVPQSIVHADTTVISASVDNIGQIESVIDSHGYPTGYLYDQLGRMQKISYPPGDSVAWNATNFAFAPNSSVQYGLPITHWKQTMATGAGRTTTYFDAYWRPVLVFNEDTTDATSNSFVVKRYDGVGREVFSSYPIDTLLSVNDPQLKGTRTFYDALDRVTRIELDSELGILTNTTEYLSGLRVRTTNPRGYSTTTSYQAYDVPSYDLPILIQAPEGVTTTITRDVFGKPLTVTRSGPAG
jgi:hypothetical protein